jgi:hypothetical protein
MSNVSDQDRTVAEVLRFEDLSLGSLASRRALVRWSDGTEGEALRWYADLCGHPHKSPYAERGDTVTAISLWFRPVLGINRVSA